MFERLSTPDPTGDAADRRLAEIAAEGAAISSQISQLQARLVELSAEAHRLDGRLLGMSARAWTTWQFGLTPSEGAQVTTLARRLPALPELAEAFSSGRVSSGVAHTLAKVATPQTAHAMVELTKVATGAQLQRIARDLRRVTSPRRGRDEESYRAFTDEHGWWDIHARLSPLRGAAVDAAVRAAAEADPEHEPAAEVRTWSPTEVRTWSPTDRERRRSSFADGLVRLADHFTSCAADRRGVVPDRFQTIVLVDGDLLREATAREGAAPTEARDGPPGDEPPGGVVRGTGPIDRTLLDEVLCSSTITYVVTRRGRPVTVTSPTRLATPRQHAALLVRDGGCAFPGCGREHYLIAHHAVPWPKGKTHLDNLVLVCAEHHRLVHQAGWRVELHDHGRHKTFVRPDGTAVAAGGPGRRVDDGDAVASAPPAPGPRHTGSGDPLTEYGRDVLLHDWLDPGSAHDAA